MLPVTLEKVAKAMEYSRAGMSGTEAAKKAGVSPHTYWYGKKIIEQKAKTKEVYKNQGAPSTDYVEKLLNSDLDTPTKKFFIQATLDKYQTLNV